MSSLSWAIPLPVLIPLFAAGLALLLYRRPRLQQAVTLAAMVVATFVGVALVIGASAGPMIVDVGSWAAPIGITLVADQLSTLMLLVSQVVTLAVLSYSIAQNVSDPVPSSPVAIFYPTFMVLTAGVSNAFLTGDLFNLYVGFEILLAASFVLITMGGTRGRIRAGTMYVVVSLVSSGVFLMAIAWIYGATGTVNMAQLSIRLAELPTETTLPMQLLLLVAFGVKAAIFPLSAWLPDSYPTAPAPVTAVFAGLLTKVGVYAVIRLQFVLFPENHLSTLLGVLAILTMIIGILGAIAQDDAKRLLSFTLVSHIGFMIWGISLGTQAGLAGAMYYAAHHIVVQTALFLIVGLIERRVGTTSLTRLSNLARRAWVVAVFFMVSAMNLVGVPPLTGFIGKLALAQSSAEDPTPMALSLLGFGILTSFLTLYVAVKFWSKAFWQPRGEGSDLIEVPPERFHLSGRQERLLRRFEAASGKARRDDKMVEAAKTDLEKERGQSSPLMYVATGSLVAAQILMAVFSGPVFAFVEEGAEFLTTKGAYTYAVFGDSDRGTGSSNEESLPPPIPPWIDQTPQVPLLPKPDLELPEIGGGE